MGDIKYTKEHEWMRLDDDGHVTIGITDYAQDQMGDIVYVELPETGAEVTAGEEVAVVESVKAASDVSVPFNGKVVAVNEQLDEKPELVNSSPEADGWFMKIVPSDPIELDKFMDKTAYEDYLGSL